MEWTPTRLDELEGAKVLVAGNLEVSFAQAARLPGLSDPYPDDDWRYMADGYYIPVPQPIPRARLLADHDLEAIFTNIQVNRSDLLNAYVRGTRVGVASTV